MFIVLVTALLFAYISNLNQESFIYAAETSIDEQNSKESYYFFVELEEENEEEESFFLKDGIQTSTNQHSKLSQFSISLGWQTNSIQFVKLPLFLSQCCLKIPFA